MRISAEARGVPGLMVRTSSSVLASVTVVAEPPQALAVRSGIDDGVSAPPCGAVRITGVLPAMYST